MKALEKLWPQIYKSIAGFPNTVAVVVTTYQRYANADPGDGVEFFLDMYLASVGASLDDANANYDKNTKAGLWLKDADQGKVLSSTYKTWIYRPLTMQQSSEIYDYTLASQIKR